MAQCCSTKRSIALWTIMLLIVIICCFVVFGVVDLSPQRSVQSPLDPSKELLLTSVVFRHGPRTPADTYPLDPHINETFYPNGWGHITNEGKQYLFEMGQWLRSRYGNYLGRDYIPDAVWAQTTGVTRTRMTMATVLAGLFPPKGTALEWNRWLNWQPIPIYSEPLDEDTFLLVRKNCPRFHEAVEEVMELPEVRAKLDENAQLMAELSRHTGLDVKTAEDVQSIYGTLKAEKEFGLELPPWTKDYFPHRLIELMELSYIYNVYTDELKAIKAGPFLDKVAKEFQAKRNGTLKPKELKISLYTGHDSTIVNVLHALGVWEQQEPVYAIMGLFELVRDRQSNEVGVQIYLRTSPSSGAIPLTIPGCGHFCPLDQFLQIVKKFTPPNREALCAVRNANYITPPPSGP